MKNFYERITVGNEDNIERAVESLDVFTKSFCMNCKETKEKNDLTFRCDECPFHQDGQYCIVKMFKNKYLPDYKNFGCMGDH